MNLAFITFTVYLLSWTAIDASSTPEDKSCDTEIVLNDASHLEDYTVNDLWEHWDCDKIFEEPRPIHSPETWAHTRKVYQAVVGTEDSTVQADSDIDGFHVHVISKQSPGKGRGNYAGRDIRKGEIIYSGINTARFRWGDDYREFLNSIEPHIACDVLQWAYVQDMGDTDLDDDDLMVSVDLDAGSFCNDGDGYPNKGCDMEAAKGYPGGCKTNYFALRDIKEGEELLCDYSSFAVDGTKVNGG